MNLPIFPCNYVRFCNIYFKVTVLGAIQGDNHVCICVLVTQSCPTLCDPMDCSPPGSSVHGILQARTLEWVAILFFKFTYLLFIFGCTGSLLLRAHPLSLVAVFGGYSPVAVLRFLVLQGTGCRARGLQLLWHTGTVLLAHGLSHPVTCGIFPDQGSNPCPLHWQVDF